MQWFKNERNADMICMITSELDGVRVHTVLDSGFYRYGMPRDPNAHRHLNHELYFVESGNCVAVCAEREYRCEAGQLLLINPGVEHCVYKLSKDAALYSFRFSLYAQGDGLLYDRLLQRLQAPAMLWGNDRQMTLLSALREELAGQRLLCTDAFKGLLQAFYAELIRALLEEKPACLQEHFSVVFDPEGEIGKCFCPQTPQEYYMDILDEFFTHLPLEKATLAELAGRLHLSISQTGRLIRNYYGMSFQQKLILSKIQKSIRLMRTTQLPLEQIAQMVGYSSYNAFFDAFVMQTGQTPSDYRKNN